MLSLHVHLLFNLLSDIFHQIDFFILSFVMCEPAFTCSTSLARCFVMGQTFCPTLQMSITPAYTLTLVKAVRHV